MARPSAAVSNRLPSIFYAFGECKPFRLQADRARDHHCKWQRRPAHVRQFGRAAETGQRGTSLSSTLAVFGRRVAVESLVIAAGIRGGLDPIESFPDWIRGTDGGCRTA